MMPAWGLFSPHLTLVRIWLAQDSSASRGQAAVLLGEFRQFVEATHNTRFQIEALALQALIHQREGDEPASLIALEQAIALAEPGGFIRLFVDLGSGLTPLLQKLRQQGLAPDYLDQVLAALPDPDLGDKTIAHRESKPQNLVEPLTSRELEVLALLDRHLTSKEIAAELVISYGTVKTHTLNIYRKLDVHKRREAIAKAKELNLL
jgi:LuxR family maltose regulon positive regulatory protein